MNPFYKSKDFLNVIRQNSDDLREGNINPWFMIPRTHMMGIPPPGFENFTPQ
jgi:hypothetical protein